MKRQLLFFGMFSASALTLVAAATSLVMALVLHEDVGALEKRARNAARQERQLRTDVAAIRRDLDAALHDEAEMARAPGGREAVPAVASAESRMPAVPAAPVRVATAPAAFVKVRSAAALSASECVYHPGDPGGLMECIRQQESRVPARGAHR